MARKKLNHTPAFCGAFGGFPGLLYVSLLRSQGIVGVLSPLALGSMVISMTAGTVFAVWLGELITQYGFSNGVSILIFTGIVARMPISLAQSVSVFQSEDLLKTLVVLALAIVVVGLIVFMNEATRQVPISYSRKRSGFSSGAASYLPLRLNQAGVDSE
jgi:preprotein translocase subunit SecY